jgi:outer membrane protein assembly factor BamB
VNNTVFMGSNDGFLYALAADTGAVKWSSSYGFFGISAVSIANGVGYAGVNLGLIRAFDLSDGSILWSAHASQEEIDTRPAIADGTLYLGSFDNNIYAYALDAGNNAAYHRGRTAPSYASLHPDFRLKPAR